MKNKDEQSHQSNSASESKPDRIATEYVEVNSNIRTLADIRFKLLALVPTLGGAAIYALSNLQSTPNELALAVSILGLLATIGVTIYDQRNTELYGALHSRAMFLEKEGKFPPKDPAKEVGGQFLERPERGRKLFGFIKMGHDPGLALIYGAVLGAWFYPIIYSSLSLIDYWLLNKSLISLGSALVMVLVFTLELLRLDGTFSTDSKEPPPPETQKT